MSFLFAFSACACILIFVASLAYLLYPRQLKRELSKLERVVRRKKMPYQDSPGWERMWKDYGWHWDFHVSTVSEGHRCVHDKDKSDAKDVGAKLTFGEVLDCGVGRMLDKLGAAHKTSFHDLGMGPGKMLIQTYLAYKNMRRCMGVELAKGRYDLGERNIRELLNNGWRGRKFLGIEFKKGEYFKIVEDVADKTPAAGWKVGDKVIAYYPALKTDKMKHKNYNAVITEIKPHASGDVKKAFYSVKYDDDETCDRVSHRYLFTPGTERTCEVWYGSLFDYPGGFDADMCILETDFPEEMHPHLIQQMTTTPIGCTFLTYHDLKKFKCYDWDNLRQVDCNVYENDRFITSWSQGWRFYLWEHVRNYASSAPPCQDAAITGNLFSQLATKDAILFKAKGDGDEALRYGEIEEMTGDGGADDDDDAKANEVNLVVRTNTVQEKQVHYENVTISSSEFDVFRALHRFKLDQRVHTFYLSSVEDAVAASRYDLHKGTVIAVHADSVSYVVRLDERGITKPEHSERFVYAPPHMLYKVGEQVMACWPRNAQNKNCPHRYKRFPAEITGLNTDGTYAVKYQVAPYLQSLLRPETYPDDYHPDDKQPQRGTTYAPTPDYCVCEVVREMWIQYPADFVVRRIKAVEDTVGTPFYVSYDAAKVASWENAQVVAWAADIGFAADGYLGKLLAANAVTGAQLVAIPAQNEEELKTALAQILTKGADAKTGLKLSRIELRNLLSNIQHLRESKGDGKASAQQIGNDLSKMQQIWSNLRSRMPTAGASNFEDTDSK